MVYIARKEEVSPSPMNTGRYELMTTETIKDVNNRNVTIPRSLGFYSLEQLNNEKATLLERVTDLEAKIQAINDIINAG
jgi:hypothetical protein